MSRRARSEARHGLGDPRIPWVVLLDVTLTAPLDPGTVAERLDAVCREIGRPPLGPAAVTSGPRRDLYADLAGGSDVLLVGLHDRGLLLAARHDAVDGLGMLAVVERLLGAEVRSSARGVDPGTRAVGGTRALLGRAWEVAARPAARVAGSHLGVRAGDAFAATTVAGEPRTADLVGAGARAVVAWNSARGGPTHRVSVAVGVSTAGGAARAIGDHSAFLRLTGVETMTAGELRHQLAHAPLQPGGDSRGAAGVDLVLRLVAPRLGSTLLVSHLGVVDAPDEVRDLAFHPVTGGGSGLSLGAATLRGRTTLTLRARGTQHDDEGLQGLLALVVEQLGETGQRA